MSTLLIGPEDFKPYADICTNVNPDRITPYLEVAQIKHLRPVLGKALYNDLLAKYADSIKLVAPVELTDAYKNLRLQLIPWLVYAAYSEYLLYSNAVATPFGTVTKRSDFSEPLDAKTLAYMAGNALNNGLIYKNDLIDYLKENFAEDDLYKEMLPTQEATRVSSSTVVPIGKCKPDTNGRPFFVMTF